MSITWETKKVQIQSAPVQWDGSEESLALIKEFIGDEDLFHYSLHSLMRLKLWNVLEEQWLNVPVGHWVVKGLKGELYPCEPGAMDMKYKIVDPVLTIEKLIAGAKGLPDSYDDPRIDNVCRIVKDILRLVQRNGAVSLAQIEQIVEESTEHPDFWDEGREW